MPKLENGTVFAEIGNGVGGRGRLVVVPPDGEIPEIVSLSPAALTEQGGPCLDQVPGIVPILHSVRAELSQVIQQGKTALMPEERIGIREAGFDSLSISSLVNVVESAIESSEKAVFEPRLNPRERVAAIAFMEYLEKFQHTFFGVNQASLGRSDVRKLLPVYQEFKQVCMEFELKLLLGGTAGASALE